MSDKKKQKELMMQEENSEITSTQQVFPKMTIGVTRNYEEAISNEEEAKVVEVGEKITSKRVSTNEMSNSKTKGPQLISELPEPVQNGVTYSPPKNSGEVLKEKKLKTESDTKPPINPQKKKRERSQRLYQWKE